MIDTLPEPPPTPEQFIERRLLECGLDAQGISVKYEDELQSFEIVLKPSAGETADHFDCIKNAAGYEIVNFEDNAMSAAYSDFTFEVARPQLLVTYESRLREKGLWTNFPVREKFESTEDYARALEAHAGLNPGSALRTSGNSILFDPPREMQSPAAFAEHYADLLAVIAYASVKERVSFGFIGNEAVSK